jgi:hypothetical protein
MRENLSLHGKETDVPPVQIGGCAQGVRSGRRFFPGLRVQPALSGIAPPDSEPRHALYPPGPGVFIGPLPVNRS